MAQLFPIHIWFDQYAIRMAYNAQQQLEYVGYARPEHKNRDKNSWGILKMTYDAFGQQITSYHANGEIAQDKTWSLRATYTY